MKRTNQIRRTRILNTTRRRVRLKARLLLNRRRDAQVRTWLMDALNAPTD
ncbi:hypothetical protein GH975_09655 [Litorivicinus lipolyticus]|jgi:hypothetical protein|uniref:Uncharacterized protein n=1 Tax=Litorivicinus lipolyticus TaxID=418701 RepID=A0A5Q2Q868_9GAMM|nr:hypothetical protein [Litorivicinus lipolyticus]QGG80819.1 hypothetical protein GH975_09655 [Litorivicinus lipolyticus]